jgi:Xaa-Pro aminopeptidase
VSSTLDVGLEDLACGGLLVLGESAADPDLARFLGPIHLGKCFLLYLPGATGRAGVGGAAWLGYLTAMERDEAARCGLDLLHPESLTAGEERGQHRAPAVFWRRVLERGFEQVGLQPTTLAIAGRFPLGPAHGALRALESSGWGFEDGRDLLLLQRKRKTALEIDAARRAAAGACSALRRCAEILASSEADGSGRLEWGGRHLTAGVVRAEMSAVLASHRLEQPRGNIVAAGEDSAVPHSEGDDGRVLRRGETIVVDLFPKRTVFADCSRTFCVGPAPEGVAASHERVLEALHMAHETARPNCRLWDVHREVCGLFEESGLPTQISDPGTRRGYVHALGHGVGYEIHENPSCSPRSGPAGVLEPGDLFTLEPGLYDPAVGYGIRLEDLCLVTDDGIENLTPLPYALDPRAW